VRPTRRCTLDAIASHDFRCRKYSINASMERFSNALKIEEVRYNHVYRTITPVVLTVEVPQVWKVPNGPSRSEWPDGLE
jgi:hypothetical protein